MFGFIDSHTTATTETALAPSAFKVLVVIVIGLVAAATVVVVLACFFASWSSPDDAVPEISRVWLRRWLRSPK